MNGRIALLRKRKKKNFIFRVKGEKLEKDKRGKNLLGEKQEKKRDKLCQGILWFKLEGT